MNSTEGIKKWDDPEYRKQYMKNYYQSKKTSTNSKDKGLGASKKDPEKFKQYAREYRQKNKDMLDLKNKTKYECPVCFRMISRQTYNHHIESNFHKNALLVAQRVQANL